MGYEVGVRVEYEQARAWFRFTRRGTVTWVERCSGFGEPPEGGKLRGCPGKNCNNLLHLVNQRRVRRWLWNFNSHAFERRAKEGRDMTILLFCNHGRHRSVAMAELLRWCILARYEFVVMVHHLGIEYGSWNRLTCQGDCAECMWQGPINEGLMQEAKARAIEAFYSARDGSEKYRMHLPFRMGQGPGPHAQTEGPGLWPRARGLGARSPGPDPQGGHSSCIATQQVQRAQPTEA